MAKEINTIENNIIYKRFLERLRVEYFDSATYSIESEDYWRNNNYCEDNGQRLWPYRLYDSEKRAVTVGELSTIHQDSINRRNTLLLLGLATAVNTLYAISNQELKAIEDGDIAIENTACYQSLSLEARIAYRALLSNNRANNGFTYISPHMIFNEFPKLGYRRYLGKLSFRYPNEERLKKIVIKEEKPTDAFFLKGKRVNHLKPFVINAPWLQQLIDIDGEWKNSQIQISPKSPQASGDNYVSMFITGINHNLFCYARLIDDVQNYCKENNIDIQAINDLHFPPHFIKDTMNTEILDHIPQQILDNEVKPALQEQAKSQGESYFVGVETSQSAKQSSHPHSFDTLRLFAVENDDTSPQKNNEDSPLAHSWHKQTLDLSVILDTIAPENIDGSNQGELADWLAMLTVYHIDKAGNVQSAQHTPDFFDEDDEINQAAFTITDTEKNFDVYAKRVMESAYVFIYGYTPSY